MRKNCILIIVASLTIEANLCATTTLVGEYLNVGTSTPTSLANLFYATYTSAIGVENEVWQQYSLAVGRENTIYEGDNEQSSFAVGRMNFLSADSSIISGYANYSYGDTSITSGSHNINSAKNSLVIGVSNITSDNRHHNGAILGANNAQIFKSAHLVIGNGTSSSQRSNSLIVYTDGDIIITKRQGDISMGDYE